MSPPRVSVLIPAYDAATTLAACLRSVVRQTLEDLECVIVDDGSRDATQDVARAAAERDARFRVLAQPHGGIVAALGVGLDHCRGHYVARLDADDVMHRCRLEVQAACLDAHPELAAVGCGVRLFPRASLGPGLRAYETWLNAIRTPDDVRREAFVECPVAHPALFARRETIAALGYRDAGWAEDYDLVLRALAAGHALANVPQRLLAWRNRPGRLAFSDPTYSIERFTACKAHHLADGFLSGHDQYVLWGYGGTGRAMRRALLAHGKRPAHIVELHPGRLGEVIHGAPVIPPKGLREVPRRPVIVSVAGETARREIRADLASMGFRELRDFVCTA